MAEVAIKEHTRRGKGGKTVHVRGYTRRVGHKGVHSPKRERKKDKGKEFEEKVKAINERLSYLASLKD